METFKLSFITVLITLIAFFLGMSSFTSQYQFQIFLISIVALIIIGIAVYKKKSTVSNSPIFVFSLISAILLLLASTGWYVSPFFFILYLFPIFLCFLYPPAVSMSLILTLVILFSFNIGSINSTYDILIIISLFTSIPLSSLLRKEYLKLKENEKKILILQDEQKNYKTTLEEILSNKISNFSVSIRQPINDIKSLTYYIQENKDTPNKDKYLGMISASSIEALRLLKEFEEDSTGRKLTTTNQ